jgi:hypothetical protein
VENDLGDAKDDEADGDEEIGAKHDEPHAVKRGKP